MSDLSANIKKYDLHQPVNQDFLIHWTKIAVLGTTAWRSDIPSILNAKIKEVEANGTAASLKSRWASFKEATAWQHEFWKWIREKIDKEMGNVRGMTDREKGTVYLKAGAKFLIFDEASTVSENCFTDLVPKTMRKAWGDAARIINEMETDVEIFYEIQNSESLDRSDDRGD